MKRLALVLALMSIAARPEARPRALRHPGTIPSPRSVLWIAAHPDDEAVVAPLLARWCIDEQVRCGLLVPTRGEAGPCVLEGGCAPDVGSVRSAEAGAASALFRADSILLRYADGGGVLPPNWNEMSGDGGAIVDRITAEIEAFAPEVVLTFDPRHGATCHPDHREVGRLVLEAVQRLDEPAEVFLLETRVKYASDGGTPAFEPAIAGALRFDAAQPLASGDEAWSAVRRDMERHASQFPAAFIESVANVARDQRAVYIAPAETALQQPLTAPCP